MVQSNTILFGWNAPVVGREGMAGELFAHTVNYLEKLKGSKSITSYEPVFMASHGGDLNGFFLIKGTHEQVTSLKSTDEWVDIVLRAGLCLTNVGVIESYSGSVVPEMMARWTKAIPTR